MKKILLSLAALFGAIANLNAQSWNMIVTHTDGTVDTFATTAVKNVTFVEADQNADQIVIKELYTSGVPHDDDPTKYFQQDKGFIIYNNSGEKAVVSNLAVGMLNPYNGHSMNGWYADGATEPSYTNEGWVPAASGIWYFQSALEIEPYSQVVVSCMSSIDNTQTYSQSVNYANKDFYAMYDPESGFNSTSYYPTPADVIPASHYLKAVEFGQGTAWALSQTSPAFFIFQTKGTTPAAFANDASNITYEPGMAQTPVFAVLKVPTEWILDGVEVFQDTKVSQSKKRLTPDVDGGYVEQTYRKGHSVYRNVDKDATLAIEGNAGKIVYNYTLGTDPNGIDAEASMRNGAKIVYEDTNNSSNDFHERQQFSLRD